MRSTTGKTWLAAYDPGVPTDVEDSHLPLPLLLDESAARHPQRPCTTFGGETLSYGQVRGLTDRLAAGLTEMGIGAGDRVALLLPNCPPFVIAYYGALKAARWSYH
jgi:long-chain acyl-CoA synthetase